jgi:GT2 family glycosyltransferase
MIALNPDSSDTSYYNIAESLVKLEQWDEAIAAYQQALKLNPNLPGIHQKLGNALQQRVKAKQAEILKIYQQKVQQNPDNLQNYYKAIELQPNDAELYFLLGNAQARTGEINQAILAYKRALQLQPNYLEASSQLENVLRQQASSSSVSSFKEIPSLEQAKKTLDQLHSIQLDIFFNSNAQITFPKVENPTLSIILVLFNRAELTLNCLQSILQSNYKSFEVVLINNNSTDKTQQLLEQVQGAKIIQNSTNLHFLQACNQAAEIAEGELILFLNNDTQILGNSLTAAINTIQSSQEIGAVGGKIILPDGTLQEAGSIIWRDGSCQCYGRGDAPNAPQYMFKRFVDYCCGAFFLTRRNLFVELGGFDTAYKPAYYEETDYCVRLQKIGKKIVYDPDVNILHYEFASSSRQAAFEQMAKNQAIFREKHQDWLQFQYQPDSKNILQARTARTSQKRLLLIDDQIPHPASGSGYTRTHTILLNLVEMGYFITLYPGDPAYQEDWLNIYIDIPKEVEVMKGYGIPQLEEFLKARSGYYDIIWVSRPHNLEQLNQIQSQGNFLEKAKIIYDSESLYCLRESLKRELQGEKFSEEEIKHSLKQELKLAKTADSIISVSESEQQKFIEYGYKNVSILGHSLNLNPTPNAFENRQNILFLGAVYELDSPNADSIRWLTQKIFPQIQAQLSAEVDLQIAGINTVSELQQQVKKLNNTAIGMLGKVADLTELYNQSRLFVAPTRFAAGIPHKVHEAAAYGLPIVTTSLIASQLGWKHEQELLVADDTATFSEQCIRLYNDAELWNTIRYNALKRVEKDCSPEQFTKTLKAILS